VAVDREKVIQAAQKLVEKKRYDKAVEEYQKILAEDPRDVRTLLKVGDLRLKAEQYTEAITTYETVGQFYSQGGFLPKALAVYKQIREIIKKHVPHLEDRFGHVVPRLAEIYSQLGYMGDALATYDELAQRLQSAGRERDVIDVFRKVTELDPTNPLPLLRLADAYMRVRDIDSAIQKLAAAAEILHKLGRRDEALKVVERLLQHRQEPHFCLLAAGIYLERAGPNDGMAALTKLQVAFKDNPRDLETLGLLARAFDVLGRAAQAVEVQKEAARIAKEAGKLDAFSALVDLLVQRAPNDEGVRALVALRSAASKASRPPSQASELPAAPPPEPSRRLSTAAEARINAGDPRASVDVEFDEAEAIEVDVESRPFALKHTSIPVPQDPTLRARQIEARAETLRREHKYEVAAAVLEAGIDALPDARELREKLCDLLIEAGEQARAIVQMIAFARRLAETNDIEGAARILDEVLLLEPGSTEATAMLGELGYAVSPSYEAPAAENAYDPNAPLPAYELEDLSAPEGGSQSQDQELENLDDPFADNEPLPSFPIEDEAEATVLYRPSSTRPGSTRPGSARPPYESETGQIQPNPGTGSYRPVQVPAAPYAGAHADSFEASELEYSPAYGQLDEAALEEVEFFSSQGMFDDARNLLDEQLQRLPGHPLLLERKRELEAMMGGTIAESGARPAPRSVVPASLVEDRSFDIAASLDALDALDTHTDGFDQQQISVESVFEQFKAGVAAQVSESDAATHYDLGVAYKEMGLFTDAIAEFEVSARDPSRECVCQSMIGMLHMQLGNVDAGIDALIRSLHAVQKTRDQELAILYEIGASYESGRSPDQALHYFQRLARINPSYFDPRGTVAERIRKIEGPKALPARAVGQDLVSDDFDAAFDELLGGKLP
jgi:tetratricopeptide (TPR) repeat protein